MGRRGRKTSDMINIARNRIDLLFLQAVERSRSGEILLSDRYVRLAFRISTRYNIRIPREYKNLYCRKCFGFLGLSTRSRIRIKRNQIVRTCLNCGDISRFGYSQKPMKSDGGIVFE